MSEKNKEELDEEIKEETDEEIKEEIVEAGSNSEVDESKTIRISDTFVSSITDILITSAISAAGLFLGNGILKSATGYYIKEKATMFMIIYIIVSLLYTSIMESGKNADTIGKRASKIKLTKTQ